MSRSPPPQKVRGKAHAQAAHTAAYTDHPCLSSGNHSPNEAPAAHYNSPQGLSHIRGWLGASISSCEMFLVMDAAAGACREQTGTIHPPVS